VQELESKVDWDEAWKAEAVAAATYVKQSKVILYYKRTCLHTINKLPRRTAQLPALRPGITTGFSQARSCHTTALSGCNQPHEAYIPIGIHQMAPPSKRPVNKPTHLSTPEGWKAEFSRSGQRSGRVGTKTPWYFMQERLRPQGGRFWKYQNESCRIIEKKPAAAEGYLHSPPSPKFCGCDMPPQICTRLFAYIGPFDRTLSTFCSTGNQCVFTAVIYIYKFTFVSAL